MKQRILTGILAGAIFLTLIFIGSTLFVFLVYFLATISLFELLRMKKVPIFSAHGFLSIVFLWFFLYPNDVLTLDKIEMIFLMILLLLSFTVLTKNRLSYDDVGFVFLSTLYVGMGFHYLIEARFAGLSYLFFAIFVIWATDTGAYFVGKTMGKRKLWPLISPNKTIEGSVGGIISAVVTAIIFQMLIPIHESFYFVIIVAVITSIFGQIGDLVESAIKRHYIVKDSGQLLPGHGGILDRFDSLLFILPILHFLQLF